MIEGHDENCCPNYNQPAAHQATTASATTTRYCSEKSENSSSSSSSYKTKKSRVANGTTWSDEKRPAAVQMMEKGPHPLDQLSVKEVKAVAAAINEFLMWTDYDGKIDPPDDGKSHPPPCPRFSVITLKEPPKAELLARANGFPAPRRQAHVIFMVPGSGRTHEANVTIVPAPGGASGLVGDVVNCTPLALGTQPLLSPDDCNLAEKIVKEDAAVAKLLKERYHITDIGDRHDRGGGENHRLGCNQPAAHLAAARATPCCSEKSESSSSSHNEKKRVAHGTTSSDEKRPAPVEMEEGPHPLDQLGVEEVKAVAAAINEFLVRTEYDGKSHPPSCPRFNVITLKEPPKAELLERANGFPPPQRQAYAILMVPDSGRVYEATVAIVPAPEGASGLAGDVVNCTPLALGTQPLLSPDDCNLAEKIVKEDAAVAKLLKERYHITNIDLLACDPWSYHVTDSDLGRPPLEWRDDGLPARLVQTFLYMRLDQDDNHYAHPLDMLPVVDLNAKKVVHIDKQAAAPKVPQASVNYHRNKIASNTYLQRNWCADPPKPLEIIQSDGASFTVRGNAVRWQRWSLRVGFNYREGLVLHDVKFDGRPVMWRGSLVEMAVPYGDPREPFTRKCAFDVGDYGLGFCANSLELGCDCLGQIRYFDAVLNDSRGQPYVVKKAVCMHEEDDGIMWKHVEYRNGHGESRRSRRLVLSFIATVVNYEYLFYWYLMQDGRIEFEIKLSGELSTNLVSEGESETMPDHGVIVAPGVNAQIHQHNFCARLDMSVDGHKNAVEEVDVVMLPDGPENPAGNAFCARRTP